MNGRITLDNWPYGNKPPQVIRVGKIEPWATFMRGRHPTFKTHTTLGHAKAALTHDAIFRGPTGHRVFRNESALYQWDGINGQWVLRVYITKESNQQDYTLWSNPDAFLRGIANVIEEQPDPFGPPHPCCAGANSCEHTMVEA